MNFSSDLKFVNLFSRYNKKEEVDSAWNLLADGFLCTETKFGHPKRRIGGMKQRRGGGRLQPPNGAMNDITQLEPSKPK